MRKNFTDTAIRGSMANVTWDAMETSTVLRWPRITIKDFNFLLCHFSFKSKANLLGFWQRRSIDWVMRREARWCDGGKAICSAVLPNARCFRDWMWASVEACPNWCSGALCFSASEARVFFPYQAKWQSRAERGFNVASTTETVCRRSSMFQKFQFLDLLVLTEYNSTRIVRPHRCKKAIHC